MKREISRSEGDLIESTGGLSQKGHKKGKISHFFSHFSQVSLYLLQLLLFRHLFLYALMA